MPSEIENWMQAIIQAAPTIINQEESTKQTPQLTDTFKKLDAARPTANKANPDWDIALKQLSDDDLYKLTYSFMRQKKNTTMDNALLRGSALASCKILYEAYTSRCSQQNPPSFDIKAADPVISDKIQVLHRLMYDTHLDLRTNGPEKAVAVEVSFALYGEATPSAALVSKIAEQLKQPVKITLAASQVSPAAPSEIPPGASQAAAINEASFFQPRTKTPPPIPRQQKMEAPEEINAIIFQERLTALKSDLEKYKKNGVAQEFLNQCNTLDEALKALTDCYKKGNYLPLQQHPLLKALSIDLSLAPEQREKNNLLTLSLGVNVLAKQLEAGIGKAIENEAKKSSALRVFSKSDPELLKALTDDTTRQTEVAKMLRNPDLLGKLGRPTLR